MTSQWHLLLNHSHFSKHSSLKLYNVICQLCLKKKKKKNEAYIDHISHTHTHLLLWLLWYQFSWLSPCFLSIPSLLQPSLKCQLFPGAPSTSLFSAHSQISLRDLIYCQYHSSSGTPKCVPLPKCLSGVRVPYLLIQLPTPPISHWMTIVPGLGT